MKSRLANSRFGLLTLVVVVCAPLSSACAGGGFFQQLPKDGTWVTYHAEMKAEVPRMQQNTGTLTLRSVGRTTEDGEKCRWIEMQFEGEVNGQKQTSIMKFLVNEKDVTGGENSTPSVLRGWKKNKDGDVEELSAREKSANGPLGFLFGGELKDAKTVKQPRTILYQKGKVTIPTATTGRLDKQPGGNAPANFDYEVRQTLWKHKSIPFGTAALEMKMEIRNKEKVIGKMKATFQVQDFGTEAKSALPDKT